MTATSDSTALRRDVPAHCGHFRPSHSDDHDHQVAADCSHRTGFPGVDIEQLTGPNRLLETRPKPVRLLLGLERSRLVAAIRFYDFWPAIMLYRFGNHGVLAMAHLPHTGGSDLPVVWHKGSSPAFEPYAQFLDRAWDMSPVGHLTRPKVPASAGQRGLQRSDCTPETDPDRG